MFSGVEVLIHSHPHTKDVREQHPRIVPLRRRQRPEADGHNEITDPAGISQQKIDETKVALRELGLSDELKS